MLLQIVMNGYLQYVTSSMIKNLDIMMKNIQHYPTVANPEYDKSITAFGLAYTKKF